MQRNFVTISLLVGLIVGTEARAQSPDAPPQSVSYPLWEFGTMPHPSFKQYLLGTAAIKEELKLTAAQEKGIKELETREFEAIHKAQREITDTEKFDAARHQISKEAHVATMEILEPGQRDRLDQIQLQSQGPFAFNGSKLGGVAYEGPPLARRLNLTDDQVKRAGEIAEAGDREIEKAATITISLDPLHPGDRRSILELVRTREFKATKQNARKAAREAWATVMRKIEAILTEPQRKTYREMLGTPFDVSMIRLDGQAYNRSKTTSNLDESFADASMVENALSPKGRRK